MTGAVRDSRTGKGRYDLLPPRALRRLAEHFEAGASKYGERNWEKGQPLSVYLDSGLRHAIKVLEGLTDEDHAVAALWNLAAFIETRERISEGLLPADLDDLPRPSGAGGLSTAPREHAATPPRGGGARRGVGPRRPRGAERAV